MDGMDHLENEAMFVQSATSHFLAPDFSRIGLRVTIPRLADLRTWIISMGGSNLGLQTQVRTLFDFTVGSWLISNFRQRMRQVWRTPSRSANPTTRIRPRWRHLARLYHDESYVKFHASREIKA
jgi:hypothetical protein